MKPETQEWVDKAEGDWVSAGRELRARTAPNFDAACFHSQQCIEKYLKAMLSQNGLPILKTHQLIDLLELLLPSIPELELLRPDLRALTLFAVSYRYPGESADRDQARDALARCRRIRAIARDRLGYRPESRYRRSDQGRNVAKRSRRQLPKKRRP